MAVATQTMAAGQRVKLDPYVLIVFGATGDLARRKLLPGLYHLSEAFAPASARGFDATRYGGQAAAQSP